MSIVIPSLPIADYVADRVPGVPCPSLNSSVAHAILTRSPLHGFTRHPRLNPAWEPDGDRAFDLGVAAHAALLEGKPLHVVSYRDEKTGLMVDATDYRKKAAQDAREAAKREGKIPVLAEQAAAIREMVCVARLAIDNSSDLAGIGALLPERTYAWQEGDSWCRCRPDLVTDDNAVLLSYKTTGANAEPNAFLRVLLGSGYDVQAAFELAGVKAATGVDARYVWLVQETEPPYAASLLGMSPMLYDLAQRKYERAVALWSASMASGQWPSYPDRVCYLEPPVWSVSQFAEKHMYADDGVEAL